MVGRMMELHHSRLMDEQRRQSIKLFYHSIEIETKSWHGPFISLVVEVNTLLAALPSLGLPWQASPAQLTGVETCTFETIQPPVPTQHLCAD